MNASHSAEATVVTGAAGFIGAHLCSALLDRGCRVVGLDNLNPYYDPALKRARLDALCGRPGFTFVEGSLGNRSLLDQLIADAAPRVVYHLAAQAGVRWSLEHPHDYSDANLVGFVNLLEACRHHGRPHLVFASSSSVYGASASIPLSESAAVDHPVSLYAATKRANELLAHSYAHLYELPVTGLRFFTVYGPWGRPDMAPMLFARAIREGREITVFNDGQMQRDFTFVDDIIDGVLRAGERPSEPSDAGYTPDRSPAPYRLFNLGRGEPVDLMEFVRTLERHLGREAEIRYRPMQPGDMVATWCDTTSAREALGFRPTVSLDEGIGRFVRWLEAWESARS